MLVSSTVIEVLGVPTASTITAQTGERPTSLGDDTTALIAAGTVVEHAVRDGEN